MGNKISAMVILETILSAVIIMIISVGALQMPILGFAIYFSVIPLVITARRRGIICAIISLTAAFITLSIMIDPVVVVFMTLIPGIPCIIMGGKMARNHAPKDILKWGILFAMLLDALALGMTKVISGKPVEEMIRSVVDGQMSEIMKISGITGSSSEMLSNMIESMLLSIPSMLMIWSIISVALNYYISISILRKIGSPAIEPIPFIFFKLPRGFIIGALIIYLLSMGVGYLGFIDKTLLMANVFLLYQFIFCVQGLAVILFLLSRYRIHVAWRTVIVILLIISGFGTMIMFFLGLFDIIVDIRGRMIDKDSDNRRLR